MDTKKSEEQLQRFKEYERQRVRKWWQEPNEESKAYHTQHYQEHKEETQASRPQYYQEHKEAKQAYDREYRKKNKELINEKQRLKYKETETKRDRSEYQQQYRETHKEEKQATDHAYYIENKEAISAKRSASLSCSMCGGRYVLRRKSTHEKSQRHQQALAQPCP